MKLIEVLNDHGFPVRGWMNGRPVIGGTGDIDWSKLQTIVEAYYKGEPIPEPSAQPKRKKSKT